MAEETKNAAGKGAQPAQKESPVAVKKRVAATKVAKKKVVKKQVVKKQIPRKKAASSGTGSAAPRGRARASTAAPLNPGLGPRERYEMIAKMAYFRAEKRGFEPGWEQQDWLESERVVDEMLSKERK